MMDTSTLKYFLVVAKTGHMTKAAQQLNITQPSLSAAIRRLEAELGYPLFDRTGRGIQLNEYGKIFLSGVITIDKVLSDCIAEMEELKQSMIPFVRLACSRSGTNSRLIDQLLAEGMSLRVDNIPNNWEQELLDDNCDLVITPGIARNAATEKVVLRHQIIVIACSPDHPLAGTKELDIEDLHRHPFCSTSAPHSLINVLKESYSDTGFMPRVTFMGRDSTDMVKAIRSGKYLGVMVQHHLPGDLISLPVREFDITLPIYLYWRKSNKKPGINVIRQKVVEFYQALQIN